MPMPTGLLPVHPIGKIEIKKGDTTEKKPSLPPSNSNFAGSSGLSHLQNQYSPLEWHEFFDERLMIDQKVPLYKAGT